MSSEPFTTDQSMGDFSTSAAAARLSDSEISDIDERGLPRGHGRNLPGVDPSVDPTFYSAASRSLLLGSLIKYIV